MTFSHFGFITIVFQPPLYSLLYKLNRLAWYKSFRKRRTYDWNRWCEVFPAPLGQICFVVAESKDRRRIVHDDASHSGRRSIVPPLLGERSFDLCCYYTLLISMKWQLTSCMTCWDQLDIILAQHNCGCGPYSRGYLQRNGPWAKSSKVCSVCLSAMVRLARIILMIENNSSQFKKIVADYAVLMTFHFLCIAV